jgi:hypothetical protein
MQILVYSYLALVGILALAVLLSLARKLSPKYCPRCGRLSLPLRNTVDGRITLTCTLASCRFEADEEDWRPAKKTNSV